MKKLHQQGDFYMAKAVVPNYSMAQFAVNDPEPIGAATEKAEEDSYQIIGKKGDEVTYQKKEGSKFVPSKESVEAMSLAGSTS